MTKAEQVFRDLSKLYEFNRRLQEWKRHATVRDPKAERAGLPPESAPQDAAPANATTK